MTMQTGRAEEIKTPPKVPIKDFVQRQQMIYSPS